MASRLRPVVVVHYHEISLKRGNRPLFLRQLARNLRSATVDLGRLALRQRPGRIVLDLDDHPQPEAVRDRVLRVCGVASASLGYRTSATLDAMKSVVGRLVEGRQFASFRVSARLLRPTSGVHNTIPGSRSDLCWVIPRPPSRGRPNLLGQAGMSAPLLALEDVTKNFVVRRSLLGVPTAVVRAVDGVSLSVDAGETLALVGESGCGKSTVGRLALRLMEPTAGRIRFAGRDLASLSGAELRRARAGAQLIFQDPYGSLNPRMTVGEMLAEPLLLHTDLSPASRRERVALLWSASR
jgi:peptide/nickel transport system ATP-binding protein/oligopeptide transport system ATP-binding protein